ncbi:MAG: small subunit ribosomal protein [Candidatus Dependentiae bacterium]|nr:small subunit ribosomal protein [Candidatus Dependentiae bacterium]
MAKYVEDIQKKVKKNDDADEVVTVDTGSEVGEFAEILLNVRRVAKVIKGGRRFAFSALVVVGDRNGSVGIALGKGREVSVAISKAFRKARKNMIVIPRNGTTVPFTVTARYGSSQVMLRAASQGTGVIAGGAVRSIMEAAGVKDILAKAMGSSNSQNVAKATMAAFKSLRTAVDLARLRGKSVTQIIRGSHVAA